MDLKLKLTVPSIEQDEPSLSALISMAIKNKFRKQSFIKYEDGFLISIRDFKSCRFSDSQIVGVLAERVSIWLYKKKQNVAEFKIERI